MTQDEVFEYYAQRKFSDDDPLARCDYEQRRQSKQSSEPVESSDS